MNRKFAGEEGFTNAFGEWQVGVPKAVALDCVLNRSYWQSQSFYLYIPITLDRKGEPGQHKTAVREGVRNREIRIDAVRTIFMTLGDTVVQPTYVRPGELEPQLDPVASEIALTVPQGLFKGGDYLCMFTDTLVIPAGEDSIRVDFSVWFKEPGSTDSVKVDFSHILWRQEGKKLVLGPGD
jgi:hypothetical protein